MANVRLIARLDIKGRNLIKGIHLEGLRVIGDPHEYACKYYSQGADELIYMDAVASLYGRNSLHEMIERTARDVFVPITVGGGIRNLDDVRNILRSGADKVAINTAATRRPELITEVAKMFGSQCMVLSVEAKKTSSGHWEVYTDNGREHTGMDVLDWVNRGVELGAGEILLTSVDQEGTRRGFDVDLIRSVTQNVTVPIISSGGMGTIEHLVDVVMQGMADGVAMADILHYNRYSLCQIRNAAIEARLEVRKI